MKRRRPSARRSEAHAATTTSANERDRTSLFVLPASGVHRRIKWRVRAGRCLARCHRVSCASGRNWGGSWRFGELR